MAYDKRQLFELRGWRCECGCGKLAHDAHHGLIGRRKRFSELDCEENILLVNHDEHLLRKFDNLQWRKYFWEVQVDRYGYDHMMKWVESLPAKLSNRIDFIERKHDAELVFQSPQNVARPLVAQDVSPRPA